MEKEHGTLELDGVRGVVKRSLWHDKEEKEMSQNIRDVQICSQNVTLSWRAGGESTYSLDLCTQ